MPRDRVWIAVAAASLALEAVALGPVHAADRPPAAAAGEASPAPAGPPAGYRCYQGGFCGSDGWAYGDYAKDTKESTGCGVDEEDSAQWDLGASHTPILPEVARPHCSFFYGINVCSIATVVCLN